VSRALILLTRFVLAPILAAARRAREGLPKRPPWARARDEAEATVVDLVEQAESLAASLADALSEIAGVRRAALGPGRGSREPTAEVVRCLRESHDELLHTVLWQVGTIVSLTSDLEEAERERRA
jgi:hypothetical protein